MKLFRKFQVSSNGPSTEWVGYEILTFYTSFLIVETTPFFQCESDPMQLGPSLSSALFTPALSHI
jgi:hypothetical protein